MSSQKSGKNGLSLPVPPEEEEEPAVGAAAGSGGESKGSVFGDEESSRPRRGKRRRRPPRIPLQNRKRRRPARHPSSPTPSRSRFRRQVPTGARKPYFIFGDAQNSVDLWFFDLARPGPLQFTGKGSGDITANDTGDLHGCRELRPGGMVGHLQAASSPKRGRPVLVGQFLPIAFSVWDGFSRERGNRRGLTIWYLHLRRAAGGPLGRRAHGENGADHSGPRARRDRLGAVALRFSRPRGDRRGQATTAGDECVRSRNVSTPNSQLPTPNRSRSRQSGNSRGHWPARTNFTQLLQACGLEVGSWKSS